MKNLLSIIFSAARSKIMPLWIKLRMWSSPAFIKSKILLRIREFFVRLFDVRPKDKHDYYPVFRWLVSKKLAFALVVILGVLSAIYISMILPDDFLKSDGGVATYKYRSLPLKFQSGTVRIIARDGYLAYEGEVDNGAANGEGTLYSKNGATVYKGQFADNKYNGNGSLYYPNGILKYNGDFSENLFHGNGKFYRNNGTLEYSGEHISAARTGHGILYNSVGDKIFEGNFLDNDIVYSDFLARATDEVSSYYNGETDIYQSSSEYCVAMPEIDALYSAKDGSDTLENQWTIDRLFVLKDYISVEGKRSSSIDELVKILDEPLYQGAAKVNLSEAVSCGIMAKREPDGIEATVISLQSGLSNVHTVLSYDRDYKVYLYTFEKSGMLYTFYTADEDENEFFMYAIEKA